MRLPDAYLNYWCDVYIAYRLKKAGIELERFLVNPQGVLSVRQRVNEDWRLRYGISRCQRRNGALVEKLTHASANRSPPAVRVVGTS